jgi:hypothetical protein
MKRLHDSDDKRNGWYEISPVDALGMLEGSPVKNRVRTEFRVDKIAGYIRAGEWSANGESIVLDNDGRLADGQHRLAACVASDVPIVSFVVYMPRKLAASFFDSIDQGRSRTTRDRLSIDGVLHSTLCAAVARHLYNYERQITKSNTMRVTELRRVYEKNAIHIDAAVAETIKYKNEFARWCSASDVAFVYMMAAKINPDKASKWLHSLATGESLTKDSPVMKARKQIQSEAFGNSIRKMDRAAVLALMIKSWNYYESGKQIKVLQWTGSKEAFPRFAA